MKYRKRKGEDGMNYEEFKTEFMKRLTEKMAGMENI